MEKYIVIISLALTATYYAAASETNATYLKILQASNDVESVIGTLPDVEKLWPQDPDTYLKSVNQAAHILGSAPDNQDARGALVNSFTNMMQKPCPTNGEQIGPWVDLKCQTAFFYFNFSEFQNDKSRWLDMAKFTGEVRSYIIPNYKPKSIALFDVVGISQERIDQNEKNKSEDWQQAALRRANRTLTFFLGNCSYHFPSSNPTNIDFIQQISDAAHLTDAERKKLQ